MSIRKYSGFWIQEGEGGGGGRGASLFGHNLLKIAITTIFPLSPLCLYIHSCIIINNTFTILTVLNFMFDSGAW